MFHECIVYSETPLMNPLKSISALMSAIVLTLMPAWSQFSPHQLPPGGLAIDNTPQFIVLSFDDNNSYSKVQWLVDSISKYRNPTGTSQSGTFDGNLVPAVWYNNGSAVQSTEAKDVMIAAHTLGHEIANHTMTHNSSTSGFEMTKQQWETEILPGMALMINAYPSGMDINKDNIGGFRAPRLETNDSLYAVLAEWDFRYDTSLEDGYQDSIDGTNFFWPYKLSNAGGEGWDFLIGMAEDNPAFDREPLSVYPDLWEIPISPYVVTDSIDQLMAARQDWHTPGSNKITGFDYNIYSLFNMNTNDMATILKFTLDKRMQGNRAPLMVGLHSDNYGAGSSRNQGIFDFIEYALDTYPDVRFVTSMELIDWMESPQGLDGASVSLLETQGIFADFKLKITPNQLVFNQSIPANSHINIVNVNGQSLWSEVTASSQQIFDLENLPQGLYRVVLSAPASRKVFVASVYE